MAAAFYGAREDMIDITKEIIDAYHPHLEEASIGLYCRDEAQVSKGRVIFGKTRKVTDEQRVFMQIEYDFLICIGEDWWLRLDSKQRRALIDHLLCYCYIDEEQNASLNHPDVVEFNNILRRHGLWWPFAEETEDALEQGVMPWLEDKKAGRVESFNNRDVLEQLDDLK